MKALLFLISILPMHLYAKEFIIYTEITPPYSNLNTQNSPGIYQEILNHAFINTEHSFKLNILNTKDLITNIKNKKIPALIGTSRYSPYFSEFQHITSIGTISLNLISSEDINISEPYTTSLKNKKAGAVYGVGFEQLLPNINLTTYNYAQQGVIMLFNNTLDVIIEDPLIIGCTSNSVLEVTENTKPLYIHSPPVKTTGIYLVASEDNKELIDLVRNVVTEYNINTLSESYSRKCENITTLKLNKTVRD